MLTNLVKSLTINFVEDLGASSSSAQDMSQTQMTSGKAGKAMLSWQKGSCFKLTQSCSKAKLELWIPLHTHIEKKGLLPSTNCNKQVLLGPLSRITVMFTSGKSLTAWNELPRKRPAVSLTALLKLLLLMSKACCEKCSVQDE